LKELSSAKYTRRVIEHFQRKVGAARVLVSDSHKLVFVHIQKTGGSTVHRLLQERVPDIRTIAPRHEIAIRGMPKPDDWEEYFKFAFVRNPWDRLVSWYSMVTKFPSGGNELWRYVHDNSSTFEEFIYNCTDEVEMQKGVYYSFAYNQLDYITDENGDLLVDFIGRLENFEVDVLDIFSRIGIGLEMVPHKNRSRHQHYSTFYAADTEMIVRERFKRDIEYFGYEFERLDAHRDAQSTEKGSVSPRQGARRRVEVGFTAGPKAAGATIRADRTPKYESSGNPGLLFVCGCDTKGTTVLADYLNRHPEIAVCPESSETIRQGAATLDPPTAEGMTGFGPRDTEDPTSNNDGNRLVKYHTKPLVHKGPFGLRWIGASNWDYMRRMESVAGNNPGARFIVIYRPIEEVAESWETKDGEDYHNRHGGFGQAVKTWNRSLQGTRRFIRDSLLPRVLLISYHDLLHRTETVVPLISRFLELEFDKPVTANGADEVLQSEKRERPEETLSREKRALIRKHANRDAEAWILGRIEKQWKKPGLYTQETSKAALAASLDEMEARTWRLQQKVKELERDRERRRRRFKRLESSRIWRLVNKIKGVRTKMAER
jgi:chondroitin 4-sulfotransferase 11